MNGPESGGGLLRGVVMIVVVGLALGVGFNTLLLAAGPKQGLPWVKHDVKLKSLEDVLGDQAATPEAAPTSEPAATEATSPAPAPEAAIGTPEATDLTTASKTKKKKPAVKPTATTTGTTKTTPAP